MKLENEGYNNAIIQKVYRIADVLELISKNYFLKNRLAFTGGTALNFVIFPKIERLSVDLDFDFREIDSKNDWGKTRDMVDSNIKGILRDLEYEDDDIRIDAKYPLTRFIVKYELRTSFNIEIGYLNRYSLFTSDETKNFIHPKTGKAFKILIPRIEEISAGKCSALISRRIPRDLFDTAIIAKLQFSRKLLRKALILKNMMNLSYNITTLNFSTHLGNIRLDDNLKVVLGDFFSKETFRNYRKTAIDFLNQLQMEFTEKEKDCLSAFINDQELNIGLLGKREMFHPQIAKHPNILWSLEKMKGT
ncbi:MAG: nucleotidyl transferase AbiEii/AbiGii toxin family protein [Promethearchaeota archaeon]